MNSRTANRNLQENDYLSSGEDVQDVDEETDGVVKGPTEEASYGSGRGSGIVNHVDNLQELIYRLNDEDHSEDEGIEDYNIGGYHPCHVGEVLINRYVLMQKLGWGHFSTVWLAKDFKYNNFVAVKIMKSSPHYLQASYDEVQILQKVAAKAYDPEWIQALKEYEPNKKKCDRDDTHVLNLLNSFLYKGPYGNHFCMVFQILGVNLLQILKRYDEKGLPLDLVKEIARQVLMGLDFLNRICHVIHTDLKPENVLLCLPQEEIISIFENQTSGNLQLYKDRINYYRHHYHLGPLDQEYTLDPLQARKDQPQTVLKTIPETTNKKVIAKELDDLSCSMSEISQTKECIIEKIANLENRLKTENVQKCQKKNIKKKIRKLQGKLGLDKVQQEKQKSIEKQEDMNVKRLLPPTKALFTNFKNQLLLDKGAKLAKGFKVKIADLGNACWQHHHFASEIQTRQYRGPQILIGSNYSISADMWSAACMFFQMLTGELLFNPRKDPNDSYGKNDDHLAQMMELVGRFPKKFSLSGSKSKKYFTKQGNLKRIPKLQNWSIKHVMIAKYRFVESEANLFEQFMAPMLECCPEKRILARQMLRSRWLQDPTPAIYFMNPQEHARIKAEKYETDLPKDEVCQYQSERDDADEEDNNNRGKESDQDAFYGYEKKGDIRLVDRSFMDLGYVGFGDGIFLETLDAGPNWQFEKQ